MRLKKIAGAVTASIALLASGMWLGQASKADSGSAPVPGSANDPVVTKSYVDQRLAALGSGGNSGGGSGGSSTGSGSVGASFDVVQLRTGQQLIGSSGTEIILRSGTATAIAGSTGGVSDVTGGADLSSGASVAANHLLVVARSDGRGIRATSDYVYALVLGPSSIH